jgi:hypothetical protein
MAPIFGVRPMAENMADYEQITEDIREGLAQISKEGKAIDIIVRASFDRWKNGTGGPFELLAPDADGPLLALLPCLRLIAARRNSSTT